MDCSGIREKLSFYVDGMLDEQNLEMVEVHLADCEECRKELSALRELIQSAGDIEKVEPPTELHAKILQAIANEEQVGKQLTKMPTRWSLKAWLSSYASERSMQWAAGVVVAGCVALVILIGTPHDISPTNQALVNDQVSSAATSRAAVINAKPSVTKFNSEVEAAKTASAPVQKAIHAHVKHSTVAAVTHKHSKWQKKQMTIVARVAPTSKHRITKSEPKADETEPNMTEVAASPDTTADTEKIDEQPIIIKVAAAPDLSNEKIHEWMAQAKTQAQMRKNRSQSGAVNIVSAKF